MLVLAEPRAWSGEDRSSSDEQLSEAEDEHISLRATNTNNSLRRNENMVDLTGSFSARDRRREKQARVPAMFFSALSCCESLWTSQSFLSKRLEGQEDSDCLQ